MANIRSNNNNHDDDGLPLPDLASPGQLPPSFHNLRVDPTASQYQHYRPGVSEDGLINRRMRRSPAASSLSSSYFMCPTPPGLTRSRAVSSLSSSYFMCPTRPPGLRRSRAVSSVSSSYFMCPTIPGVFDDVHRHPAGANERRVLDSCAMCNRPLGTNQDIFMYRGNIPFCSDKCRQDQIDTDEINDRKRSNLAAKAIMSTRNDNNSSNNQPVPISRPTGAIDAG